MRSPLSLSLYQCHYPSLASITHQVVALIIIFEGAIITGEVAKKVLKCLRQYALTKTNSLQVASTYWCLSPFFFFFF